MSTHIRRAPIIHYILESYKVCRVYFACVLVVQLCLFLCHPKNCSPPGPLSMEFSRQETGVGCHSLLQGIFPNPGLELRFPALQADSFLSALSVLNFLPTCVYRPRKLSGRVFPCFWMRGNSGFRGLCLFWGNQCHGASGLATPLPSHSGVESSQGQNDQLYPLYRLKGIDHGDLNQSACFWSS